MNAFIFCTADFELFAVCFLIVSRNVLGRKFEVPNETQSLERKRIFHLLLQKSRAK